MSDYTLDRLDKLEQKIKEVTEGKPKKKKEKKIEEPVITLLADTLDELQENGKTPDDVLWVGDEDGKVSWEQFAEIANVHYRFRGCVTIVNPTLVVVGDGWWLERLAIEDSCIDCWQFKTAPTKPDHDDIVTVFTREFHDRTKQSTEKKKKKGKKNKKK